MRALRPHVRVAFAVPGQGSQTVGMGKTLHADFPAARAVFDRVEAALNLPLRKLMFEGPKEGLTQTAIAQPAIFTHALAAFEAYKAARNEHDVRNLAKVALGHSVGEFAALCIAGALSIEDSHLRGDAMQKAVPTGGAMAALMPLDEATAAKICSESEQETSKVCDVANVNSGEQVVISGDAIAVVRAGELSKKHGVRRVIPLEVSAPFHCKLMAPAAAALAGALASIQIRSPLIPVLSNVTGLEHGSADEVRALLVKQVTAPVRWNACVARIRDLGCDTLVEFGPGEVLSNLVKRAKPPLTAVSMSTADQVRTATQDPPLERFSALAIDGKSTVNFKDYHGKVLLIVNVASKCGYTSQYSELEALYRKYKARGVEVLGFPCNQFGWQEPHSEAEIEQFCKAKYGVSFPMFAKVEVNGPNAHPLWTYLKADGPSIKWNFTKFLVDRTGRVAQRFGSSDTPAAIEKHIEKLLL